MPNAIIVDDDDAFAPALAKFIEAEGYRVRVASSVEEARIALRAAAPEVALIDPMLPDGSGLDLINEIDATGKTDVVVITAYPTLDTAIDALRGRAVEYLVKPLDIERLKSCIRRFKVKLGCRSRTYGSTADTARCLELQHRCTPFMKPSTR